MNDALQLKSWDLFLNSQSSMEASKVPVNGRHQNKKVALICIAWQRECQSHWRKVTYLFEKRGCKTSIIFII